MLFNSLFNRIPDIFTEISRIHAPNSTWPSCFRADLTYHNKLYLRAVFPGNPRCSVTCRSFNGAMARNRAICIDGENRRPYISRSTVGFVGPETCPDHAELRQQRGNPGSCLKSYRKKARVLTRCDSERIRGMIGQSVSAVQKKRNHPLYDQIPLK